MSGHSKWSTIKRKKGAADSRRSKMFSRIAKEITIAVKSGGAEPEANPRLRVAIANAKGLNMPKENISRAISKGEKDEAGLQEVTLEGYLPHGIAIFIECLTDNNNRTVASVRSAFNKHGGKLGTNGSLSSLFERKGIFMINKEGISQDDIELDLIDAGAQDFESDDETLTITCAKEDFGSVNRRLNELGIEAEEAGLKRVPNNTKTLDIDSARKVLRFVEALEDDDDIQNVYHNLEISDELAEELG